jgi:precorrin-6Y C5,15-methyltransferase (decarboxylating)
VVTALATIERVSAAQRALVEAGYRVEGTVIQASRLAPLGEGTRLAATNPVFVVWGERQ